MKTRHLILTLACATGLPLAVLLPVTTSSAKPEAPAQAKAKNRETCEIKVREGVKLTLEAEVVDDNAERVMTSTGYINYKGKVYTGVMSPPRCILTSGVLEIDGKKIVLDVSGISSPWIAPEELTPEDVHVEIRTEKLHSPELGKLVANQMWGEVEVYFRKGGADDHLVHWAIQGEASLRNFIENRDHPPKWQEERQGPEKGK